MVSLENFLELPAKEVAQLVRDSGPKVVVFPINGIRRWFMLEYGSRKFDDPIAAYYEAKRRLGFELEHNNFVSVSGTNWLTQRIVRILANR